ncbi:hypothetical protein BJV77DRAFT_1039431 [Russula vinacea]|nr:hypothetical protein BJV77DRAFT_1039431 [Russula vinacea]
MKFLPAFDIPRVSTPLLKSFNHMANLLSQNRASSCGSGCGIAVARRSFILATVRDS